MTELNLNYLSDFEKGAGKMIYDIYGYAEDNHKAVRHKYDGFNYNLHLKAVTQQALKYIRLITYEKPLFGVDSLDHVKISVMAAACCHDLLEDCRLTFNDLVSHLSYRLPTRHCGRLAAEIVYRCTNNKGRDRAERADDKFYSELKEMEEAVYVKFCDRLANLYYSKMMNSGMFQKYKEEHKDFTEKLYIDKFTPIFMEMDQLMF